ncbi:RICIN domain-containing protein [Solwaraspora sp. WMMD791]|uniref:pectate lyase family protein n=1 Tax=Solwaraspora sp. WMMD791 TaxID=3016086 RepID=UPI00249C5BAE|nr:RICIN domain-containing protein [Solwaraspora sp. WMMD791]WFE27753.1 RICIN domain-containing protein [Solwaraspora sp. WMMD791]
MTTPTAAASGTRRRRRLAVLAGATAAIAAAAIGAVGITTASAATVSTSATYVFVSRHSNKAMDVYNWATNDGAEIRQWSRNDSAVQRWQFVDVGSGYYKIRSEHSGKFLELPNASDGTRLVQNSDNGTTRQHWRLADSDSGYVRFINRHSNKTIDVWEWSTADGGYLAGYTDLNGWNQQWQLITVGGGNPAPTTPPPGQTPTGIVGWATQNGGTTGGGSASATTVTSASALTSAVGASGAAVIRISGTISCSGMIRVRDNKTILGVGSGATLSGCGFTINGNRNVIIRNVNFRNWDDDAINVEGSATNIWIDHNSFTNGYDGAVDIKRGSDFITVSWNRVFGHDKSMLLGHSDSNASQDVGHLRVTYHHNWFDGSNQRHPRVRFGNPVHVFNNFYSNIGGYGVASTMNAGVLVEGNYFENTSDPFHLGEGSSGPGSLVARNNHFVNSGSGQTGGSVAGIPYGYTLTTASQVKSVVTNGAGTGRIGL